MSPFPTGRPLALAMAVLGGALLLALSGVVPSVSPPHAQGGSGQGGRPNIVLVTTDDQTLNEFGRKTMPSTKRLLGKRGTTFKDAIVTTPECCPSRATMITGQYAHNHGILSNERGYKALRDKPNVLPVWLQRAGYSTAHVGKFLNGYTEITPPSDIAPGWDKWVTTEGATKYYRYDLRINGRSVHFGGKDRHYVTRVLNRKARKTAKRLARRRRPFYLQLDHRAPHNDKRTPRHQADCGPGAPPDPRDVGRFAGERLPQPRSFNERNVKDKPSFVRAIDRLSRSNVKRLKKIYRCALASLYSVDRGIRKIWKALKRRGEHRRTVLIFTSDNGFYHGEHRIKSGKSLPYEEGLRVPLLMRVPKRYLNGTRVAKVRDTVANIDLAPTILELAGAEAGRPVDGRSLLPAIRGQRRRSLRARGVLVELDREDRSPSCTYAGIRTHDAVYVEHARVRDPVSDRCVRGDERELYDLKDDPLQLRNRYPTSPGDPMRPTQQDLERRLAELRDCSGTTGINACE